MEPEAAVTGCSQTKDTGMCAGQWRAAGALGQTQSRGSLQTRPGRPAQVFLSIPHRPQLAELASQMGEDLGLHLQWSPACAKAAGTCVALASLVPLVPRRGRGSSEMLHSSFVLLFSREKSNSEAAFPVLSLFCQCQSDLLCQIT